MPQGNLPAHAREIFDAAESAALKGTCKGDEECAAKVGWSAVKKKYKKEGDKWVPKSEALAEFSFVITKAALDKATGEMRWSAVASDTDWDSYEERMSLELFSDFVRRAETKEPVPEAFCSEAWCGGLPYPSVAHYSDLDGRGIAGETRKLYIDGNRLKASGIFYDTPLGRACFRSVCEDLYSENKAKKDKVRISIGFLDYAHSHGNVRFERKSITDRCSMCAAGAPELTYLKGHLLHLALTRVPVNKRTDIVPAEVDRAMTTRKEDAASIVGEELAEELERESIAVGKSEALVERAEECETCSETEETPVETETVEMPVEEPEPQVDDIRQELAQIKSAVSELVLLAKKDEEEECSEEMKKEGKCKEHMKEKKSHVLDPVLDTLKSEFDRVLALEATDGEKLNALQEPYNAIAEALRDGLAPVVIEVEPVVEEGAVDYKGMIQEAILPLVDQMKLLQTQLSAVTKAQTVQSSTPQRRSLDPVVIKRAEPVAEKPNSFAAVAKRSVGLQPL